MRYIAQLACAPHEHAQVDVARNVVNLRVAQTTIRIAFQQSSYRVGD
jgi:hypothetical protein